MEEAIATGTRNRDLIQSQKMKRTGKYLNTWFLAGETQNTLKIQGVPDSKLLVTLRDQFGDRMGA